jgi:hypothetical protein
MLRSQPNSSALRSDAMGHKLLIYVPVFNWAQNQLSVAGEVVVFL